MNVLAALGLAIATGAATGLAVAALAAAHRRAGPHAVRRRTHCRRRPRRDLRRLRPYPGCAGRRCWPRRGRMPSAQLAVVFGAGGDRDRGKRPLMGQVATELADHRLCHRRQPAQRGAGGDSPRDPRRGARRRRDRRPARAPSARRSPSSNAGDVLVIAGKGHETGQIVGGETLPFDDVVVAREAIAAAGAPMNASDRGLWRRGDAAMQNAVPIGAAPRRRARRP